MPARFPQRPRHRNGGDGSQDGPTAGFIKQEALYETFIDLRKAYDVMDRERCLEILEGYGVGPNILRLIERFWELYWYAGPAATTASRSRRTGE